MKRILLILMLLGLAQAQPYDFPTLSGKALDDSELSFPEAFMADYNLLVFPLEQGQEADARTWEDYLLTLHAERRDFDFYQVFLLDNFNFLLKAIIRSAMEGEYEAAMKARSMPLFTSEIEEIKAQLGLQDTSSIHLLLVHDGAVLWRSSGLWSEEKARALEQQLP